MRKLWSDATDKAGNVIDVETALKAHVVAKDAAPFVHPKLAAVEHSGVDGEPIQYEKIIREIVDPAKTED
jgi:hypothetical protein